MLNNRSGIPNPLLFDFHDEDLIEPEGSEETRIC